MGMATIPLNPLGFIEWTYFFGGQSTTKAGRSNSTRYYSATINGVKVEKCWQSPNKTTYSIGNHDKAKKKFRTETELVDSISKETKV